MPLVGISNNGTSSVDSTAECPGWSGESTTKVEALAILLLIHVGPLLVAGLTVLGTRMNWSGQAWSPMAGAIPLAVSAMFTGSIILLPICWATAAGLIAATARMLSTRPPRDTTSS